MNVHETGRIVSVAVTVALGVNGDGRSEVLGMAVGPLEAVTFWTDFFRGYAHEGLKAAIPRVLRATWKRCGIFFKRNATAHAGKTQRRETCRSARRPVRLKVQLAWKLAEGVRQDTNGHSHLPKDTQ